MKPIIYEAVNSFNPINEIEKINSGNINIFPALEKDRIDFHEFLMLLTDKASNDLMYIADAARRNTIKRFGKVINFYVPVYLSNVCNNICTYCGFNHERETERITLDFSQIEKEYIRLKELGFDNVLLLTGDAPLIATPEYIARAVSIAKKYFTFVALEIYPMSTEQYRMLVEAGADGLTIYQETYDAGIYSKMHLKGKKKDYKWRIYTPERALEAGIRKIGLGSLLGLSDWRYEAVMLALHVDFLQKNFWKSEITLSFPRLLPVGDFDTPYPMSDKELIQMICALRMYLPEVGFVLSTRESSELRDNLIQLCITQMSAGSRTNPGGYSNVKSEEQFSSSDKRSLDQMMDIVRKKGYDPVLKDWEKSFIGIQK